MDNSLQTATEMEADAWAIPEAWNAVTRDIIAAAIRVHTALGPGLPERLYEEAMEYELNLMGHRISRQHSVRLKYKDLALSPMKLDLVVDDLVIVELKAIDHVPDNNLATLLNYLVGSGLPLGLIINFNVTRLKDGIYRRINKNRSNTPK